MAEREERRYRSEAEIGALVRGFEGCTLPFERWTHEAHLTVALWFLAQHGSGEAVERICAGIRRYNLANGVAQTPQRGYHETISRFYIWAVGRYLAGRREDDPSATLLDLTNDLLGSRYGERSYPFEYYTRARLLSWEARTGWVEPDVRALEG